MKTRYIILVALLLGIHSIISAQNTIENEEYTIKHLITDINNNKFTSAVENITHVNNWELVPNSLIQEDIDIRNIDAFLKYSKRKHIPKNLQDSLYRKISYYYAILGYYRTLKGSESQEWTDALHFAEKYLGRKDSLYWYLLDHQATIFGHTNDYIRVDSCMEIKLKYQKYLEWDAFGKYSFLGYEVNDFNINANAVFKAYPFRKDRQSPLELRAHFETSLKEPDYYQQHLFTNHYKWDNDFGKISTTKVEASLSVPRWKLAASFGYALLSNNIYYDTLGIARQNTKPMSVMTASLRKDFQLWKFHFDHRLLFQLSSDKDVMPLPMLGLNLRYYAEFDVVKNAMTMQIGANGTFTTKWYAPAYNPVLGVFHNQNKEQFGNCPYIDVFVNVQWKRVSVFLKAVNLNMGWPNESADYFSAAGYIAPQRTLKIGVTWPFYVQAGKKSTSASGGKGTAGGGRSGGAARGGGANSGLRPGAPGR